MNVVWKTVPEDVLMPAQQNRLLQHQETHTRGHPSTAGTRGGRIRGNIGKGDGVLGDVIVFSAGIFVRVQPCCSFR